MTCSTCNHPTTDHKDGAGICTYEGCMCNLYREVTASWPWQPPSDSAYVERDEVDPDPDPDPEASVITRPLLAGCCGEDLSGQPANALHDCPVDLVLKEFIIEMGKVMRDGVRGDRVANGWQDLSASEAKDKVWSILRHAGHAEFAALACNAMILWWHFQREAPTDTIAPGDGG